MTLAIEVPVLSEQSPVAADIPANTQECTLYTPQEALLRSLGELGVAEAQATRLRLSKRAGELHTAALQISVEQGQALLPRAVTLPGAVGAETVSLLAVARKAADRRLIPHPTDPLYHLIVPR